MLPTNSNTILQFLQKQVAQLQQHGKNRAADQLLTSKNI